MDTSEQYIKMCDCPEIQEQWNPNIYDFAVKREGYQKLISTTKIRNKFYYIFLPRQDQIQEMMPPYDHPSTMIMYFSLFANNEEMFEGLYGSHRFKLTIKSMEQLWLAFYMWEKHKKTWDGEKWVA